ncbi:MAG TPA: choice-of-anchor B family protein, partial [Woeseiaceae bacterium]|nr:choice-of-anchor B family protein [Woeseiaceae bacterium]
VTDPEQPREVGFIDGQDTTWRDIKVLQSWDAIAGRWQAYAYVTADGSTDGLFIIDLTRLPHSISRTPYISDYFRAHNVYAGGIDFGTGIPLGTAAPYLIIAGSSISGGQYRMYSLANPESPAFVGGASSSADYMHDGAAVVVVDSRKDTQCVNATDYCEVLLDFNESTVDLWDITAPASPQRLSRTPYADSTDTYTHSGWPSEDGRYVFVHDELDERKFSQNTRVRVFDIGNLAVPALAGTWIGPTGAIDHNGFVRGNRYYVSNYSRGLTVLDISNPAAPVHAGYLDTYPGSNPANFVGAWGVYPYLHSRIVAISDINSGLYLATDRTLDVPQGNLHFSGPSYAATEGQPTQLTVERSGGSTGAVSVDYQVIPATASTDDYVLASGTLSWAAGNVTDRTIDISTVNDGVDEGLERILVRLLNPTGGATLGGPADASLYIGDPGAASEIAFAESTVNVTERGFGMAVVVLQRIGSGLGAVSADYSMSGGDAANPADFSGATSGTITWASGDANAKWLEFPIVDDAANETTEYFELSLNNVSGASVAGPATVRVNIENGTGSNQAPNAVAGTGQTVAGGAQVTLNGNASNDPNGDALSYTWQQTSGPLVNLGNANTAAAQFVAPSVQSDVLLQFRLTVRDPAGLSDTASTTVTVLGAGGGLGGDGGSGRMSVPFLLLLGALVLLGRTRNASRVPRFALSRMDGAG